ncbi:MAG TPA: hypothetical protein VEW03_10270 [Longimicrobiaceae bacterium]|nr:hypothetical protein [Longimicrobiaceae bacterium]
MKDAAELAALPPSPPAAIQRSIRALPVGDDDGERGARERLIHCLAADRLRDLRDEGVTLAYVARMYGVDAAELEAVQAELVSARMR